MCVSVRQRWVRRIQTRRTFLCALLIAQNRIAVRRESVTALTAHDNLDDVDTLSIATPSSIQFSVYPDYS